MDLIFYNGEKLYAKQKESYKRCVDYLEKDLGKVLLPYKKTFVYNLVKGKETNNIYGDDFKVEISPKVNSQNDFVLSIKDYDENQVFENEINISFDNDELRQLISLLEGCLK